MEDRLDDLICLANTVSTRWTAHTALAHSCNGTRNEVENIIRGLVYALHARTRIQYQCVEPIFNVIYYQIKSLHVPLFFCYHLHNTSESLEQEFIFMIVEISRGLVRCCALVYLMFSLVPCNTIVTSAHIPFSTAT